MQGSRRMIHGKADKVSLFFPLTVDPADGFAWKKPVHGESAESHDNFWFNYRQLLVQPWFAGFYFLRQRIAVARRPAFDDVGNKNIISFKSDRFYQLGQEFPCGAAKGSAGAVFIESGCLSDKHDFSQRIALTRHGTSTRPGQTAPLAAMDFPGNIIKQVGLVGHGKYIFESFGF